MGASGPAAQRAGKRRAPGTGWVWRGRGCGFGAEGGGTARLCKPGLSLRSPRQSRPGRSSRCRRAGLCLDVGPSANPTLELGARRDGLAGWMARRRPGRGPGGCTPRSCPGLREARRRAGGTGNLVDGAEHEASPHPRGGRGGGTRAAPASLPGLHRSAPGLPRSGADPTDISHAGRAALLRRLNLPATFCTLACFLLRLTHHRSPGCGLSGGDWEVVPRSVWG